MKDLDNPFKRDERAEMKAFWWSACFAVSALFWGCIILAVLWGRS